MKRNVTLSIAAGLLIAAAAAQADSNILVAGEFENENMIVESRGAIGAGGGSFEPHWREVYPFPAEYGTAVD